MFSIFLLFFISLFIWASIFIFKYVYHRMTNEKRKKKKKETSSVSLFHYLFYNNNNVISQGAMTYLYYLGLFMVGLYFFFPNLLSFGWLVGSKESLSFFYYQSSDQSAMGAGYQRCVFVRRKAQHPSIIISSGSQVDGCQASRGW